MIRRPLTWLLWIVTWSISWWIGISGIISMAVSDFYFGEAVHTTRDIRQSLVSLCVIWLITTVFQVICLHSYLQIWSVHFLAWIASITITFSVWWTGLIFIGDGMTLHFVFVVGWLILGLIQLLLLRILSAGSGIRFFGYWFGVILLILILHEVQLLWEYTNILAFMLPGVSLPGVLYGASTGIILDRAFSETPKNG